MAEVEQEPQSAGDYDNRTTAAVKSVLVEIGQILGSFRGKFAVVGGAVPWLLLKDGDMEHVGTYDVDLNLDASALEGGEYADLIKALMGQGYHKNEETKDFQLRRMVRANDGGDDIDVRVDFLMPTNVKLKKNKPKVIENFRVQRADGADLAIAFNRFTAIEAEMPDGGLNRVEIAVCSIPALMAMKGFALQKRKKRKDAYDVYFCVRNYPGGVVALANDCREVLAHQSGTEGFGYINAKFAAIRSVGPTWVRQFVESSPTAGSMTLDQWQQDAFGQIDELMKVLGLRN